MGIDTAALDTLTELHEEDARACVAPVVLVTQSDSVGQAVGTKQESRRCGVGLRLALYEYTRRESLLLNNAPNVIAGEWHDIRSAAAAFA